MHPTLVPSKPPPPPWPHSISCRRGGDEHQPGICPPLLFLSSFPAARNGSIQHQPVYTDLINGFMGALISAGKEGGVRRGCRTVNSSTQGMGPSASSLGSDPPATAERVRVLPHPSICPSSGYFVFSILLVFAIGLWGLGKNSLGCLVACGLCCVPVL